jgi:hypothetical protein
MLKTPSKSCPWYMNTWIPPLYVHSGKPPRIDDLWPPCTRQAILEALIARPKNGSINGDALGYLCWTGSLLRELSLNRISCAREAHHAPRPALDDIPKAHFWVEGIHQDIRQMSPLIVPEDLAFELSRIHEVVTKRSAPTIRGKSDILLQILENTLAGSAIAQWAAELHSEADVRYVLLRLSCRIIDRQLPKTFPRVSSTSRRTSPRWDGSI